ncbi:hypothetical protein PVK06_039717 [Gossypium arboreum]|uniref:Uncharacterized protein n=1 Tax=Gossypium arboreum TaxID=29729 RepID=A0ABR0N3N9_GOSAR|nr:hypothetical protein PVK06_039717 [Gossypium arboreum]
MTKSLKQQLEVQSYLERIGHHVPNSDHEGHHIIANYPKLDCKSKQEFGIEDHDETLNIAKDTSTMEQTTDESVEDQLEVFRWQHRSSRI